MNDPYGRAGLGEVLQLLGDEPYSRTFPAAGGSMKDVSTMFASPTAACVLPSHSFCNTCKLGGFAHSPQPTRARPKLGLGTVSWLQCSNVKRVFYKQQCRFLDRFRQFVLSKWLRQPSEPVSSPISWCRNMSWSHRVLYLASNEWFNLPVLGHLATPRDDQNLFRKCTVHPLCPTIDEQNFWWHYSVPSEEQFFGMFLAIMFNAMTFAAFVVSV